MSWDDMTDSVMEICRDTFSTPILYTPSGGVAFEAEGIFDDEVHDVVMLDGAFAQSRQPRLGMRILDLPGGRGNRGDRVVVKGNLYRVIEFQPDGQAGCSLILEKVTS